jgi:choline-sulfatase
MRRRDVIKSAAAAFPLFALGRSPTQVRRAPARPPNLAGMNVILLLTDQERAIQHFPPGWSKRNLPGLTYLQDHGLTYENAVCNSCMCSPSRATLMSGYFPAQHGVKYTLERDMPADAYPQVELSTGLHNPASVMSSIGYNVVYKGKWHISKPEGAEWAPSDLAKYGFNRWNSPDAGADQSIPEAGGGYPNNDGRYMNSVGSVEMGAEGVHEYLTSYAARQQPFFMVISLVNPHDVLLYPKNYINAGYNDSWLKGEIGLPSSVYEDLSTKPRVQQQFLNIFNLGGPLPTPQMKRNYLNFYGNLMKLSDSYVMNIIKTLNGTGLLNNTLIVRTADHGEMGLAHGGLRQKNFNFYEEALRVPLVYSNPRLFKRPRTSKALVSHVDFLPTLAGLFNVPMSARSAWQGVDYSRDVLYDSAPPAQTYTVFTYDDYQSGQMSGPYPTPPNHIRSIREGRYKLAEYYDINGVFPSQWEMYDRLADPSEIRNIAYAGHRMTRVERGEYFRLRLKLERVKETRLQPLT